MINIEPEWSSGMLGVIAPIIVRWITGANLQRKYKSLYRNFFYYKVLKCKKEDRGWIRRKLKKVF